MENHDNSNTIQIAQFTNGLPIVSHPEIITFRNSSLFTNYDLTLYSSPFPLMRLGKSFDGGYLITYIPNHSYSVIISAGIDDDISFEFDFCKLYPETFCFAFDGSIIEPPNKHSNIYFIKKNIGINNTELETNLSYLLKSFDNIFLKMDIEGSEIPWFLETPSSLLSKVSQMTIEFHFPYEPYAKELFNKINQTHYLIHFHPNNACQYIIHNGIVMPTIFECTYINKKIFTSPLKLNTETLPRYLDMPNSKDHPILLIDYKPFVHSLEN